ncbi:MAG: formyltransferase family protein [Chthoniobacterales bacterium]|nr:formyltransferase family protein [Chthoniobacterales bacterium]
MPFTSENRSSVEQKHLSILQNCRADLPLLACYMRILNSNFLDWVGIPIINIHHSFLPAFKGPGPYHQAYAPSVKMIGATTHYVPTILDEGPIIAKEVAHVNHRHSIQEFVELGRDLEKLLKFFFAKSGPPTPRFQVALLRKQIGLL